MGAEAMNMQRGGRFVACVACLLVVAKTASAEVSVKRVPQAADRRLVELIRLELGSKTDVTDVEIDASDPVASVTLRRRDGSARTGTIALGGPGSDRLLALFIGELDQEAPPPPAPAAEPDPPVKAPDPPAEVVAPPAEAPIIPASPRRSLEPSIFAGGVLRFFGATAVYGPTLHGDIAIGPRFRVALHAHWLAGAADDALGTIRGTVAGGGVSIAYRATTWLETGPSIEADFIGGRGEGRGARDATGYAIGPVWRALGRLPITSPLTLMLAVEVGWLAPGLELHADDRMGLRLAGPFAGGSLLLGASTR